MLFLSILYFVPHNVFKIGRMIFNAVMSDAFGDGSAYRNVKRRTCRKYFAMKNRCHCRDVFFLQTSQISIGLINSNDFATLQNILR